MAKQQPKNNKAYTPAENKVEMFVDLGTEAGDKQAVMVKVKILPLRGVGGYGYAGDEVWMPEAEAEYFKREGYVEILKVEE